MRSASSRRAAVAVVLLLSTGACSGGGGDEPAPGPATVEESLAAFGVDTTPTARADDDQDALPDSYTPFGTTRTFARTDELALIGVPLSPAAFGFDSTFTVFEEQPDLLGQLSTQALLAPAAATTPWTLSRGAAPETLRAAAAGDVDGDGLEELVVLAHAPADGAWLRVWEDDAADYVDGPPIAVDVGGVPRTLALALGDFDGDGKADAAVVSTSAAGARVAFLRSGPAGFEPDGDPVLVAPLAPGAAVEAEVAAGNLDYDAGEELVLVVNESFLSGGQEAGNARWFALDDASAAHGLRGSGLVRGTAAGTVRTAVLAGVAVGDVDGDAVDEVVFGGLTGLDPAGECRYAYVLVALDDLKRGLAPLGARYVANALEETPAPACSPEDPLRLRKVHVLALDLDSDGAAEVQVNQLTYEDFRAGAPWTLRFTLPLELLFGTPGPGAADPVVLAGTFDPATSAFAAGDFTTDRRHDVAFVSQAAAGPAAVHVWALFDPLPVADPENPGSVLDDPEGWYEATAIPLAPDPGEPVRPLLVAANVDRDSLAVKFSEGEHRLVFTEPVVIAALAAAPCSAALGQDLSACVTSFGTATSENVATEDTYTLSVGAVVGGKVGGSIFGVELSTEITGSVKAEWGWKTSSAYSLTRRVVYSTGAVEDGVVFTTIPYDEYTYQVLSHPNPAYVGQEIVIALPRSPIHILAERGFYNAHVPADATQVDERVFTHVAGDPRSYRTVAQKDDLLATHAGLATDRVDVGQGAGNVSVELNVYEETGSATSFGVEATLDVRTTAGGAILGFSVGGGAGRELRISHGRESLYAGSVSNLPAGTFATGRYSFGLFTYVHDDPSRPFEVVDYWVE